ncbi:MAG: [FeFe] hydrogenase H-cluster radical SAM maturase HydG [Candidatus Omnitrophota bacterium]|nr:[FeFe] hydrogenase H-cluster radical SAM maturase HydG [Candidatus Omnitrophota bacterium]
MEQKIINQDQIQDILSRAEKVSPKTILNILKKARKKQGLNLEEAGFLLILNEPQLKQELFNTASFIKEEIYGERLVFFAPLYISDFCVNDCKYCNFHISNQILRRLRLSLEEIEEQTKILINMGHKRILLECAEDPINCDIDFVIKAIERIYAVAAPKGNIRRINVNIAATSRENYRKLKSAKIGTYQLFQETYHRETYEKLHNGPKQDYERQITAHCRAFEAGLDDLGIGVLFGLYDWRFEVLALISHAQFLDKKYGVGPHTISVPRFRPGPTINFTPAQRVSDNDFLKLIAILRLAVPYTGMIISTRESPQIRRQAFKIGISQASAASQTSTGGYGKVNSQPQFELEDKRSLEEVIKDVVNEGFLPSFCTACYRSGRTGKEFMRLSKPGQIHKFCRSNGLLTFSEYLEDFVTDGLKKKAQILIKSYLEKIEEKELRKETEKRILSIKQGERDLYF